MDEIIEIAKHHGCTVTRHWCKREDGSILPSCEGHWLIEGSATMFDQLPNSWWRAIDRENELLQNWGSYEIRER